MLKIFFFCRRLHSSRFRFDLLFEERRFVIGGGIKSNIKNISPVSKKLYHLTKYRRISKYYVDQDDTDTKEIMVSCPSSEGSMSAKRINLEIAMSKNRHGMGGKGGCEPLLQIVLANTECLQQ
uniref:AlNc14C119G6603 protein n=1 Tax=Albugo laibachii Nc14 TaxID=890382 RepID=F0WJ71_9STRA|nr:AlNc14C119G6603 [Albugo laibachii Nc14]|eukprot:CCA21318.1 AlNc14C119G6603 [Albugo laibachii Nc14]